MHNVKKITDDMFWVGASDKRLALFENIYPLENGVSYNSYFVDDEKTILFDTVDKSVSGIFYENLEKVLNGRNLDYLVVLHMEPDHCSQIKQLSLKYPGIKIIGNKKTINLIKQFFDFDIDSMALVVDEGDTICTGRHTFKFILAPMVHWPETMVAFDETDKILYSGDAFGTFNSLDGNIYADEVNFQEKWLPEARRYYANIVGKYGPQVQMLLNKASGLGVKMLCPLHGPVWRENLEYIIEKYARWSSYTPEEPSVMIAVGSIYGNTQNVADILAQKLAAKGIRNISVYDTSKTDVSQLVAECFRCSHLVFASSTYNNGIFTKMENLLTDLAAHNLQNRKVAIIENGSWAPVSGKLMREIIGRMKNMTILENTLTIKSSLKEDQLAQLDAMAEEIYASLKAMV